MRCIGKNITITVNHLTISYNDEGPEEAPVIIFIHGFPFNKSMWDQQLDALKDNYRVIAYDVRGQGNSDSNGAFSIDIFGKELIDFMDKLAIGKATLCGLAIGGHIALNAMVKYPHSFNALVLANTKCAVETAVEKIRNKNSVEGIRKYGVEQYADDLVKVLFDPASFTTRQKEVSTVKKMIVETNEFSLCNTLQAISDRKEMSNKLQDIDVPVMIIIGKEDKITPPAAVRLMHEKIKDSILTVIEHAGHLTNIDRPIEFNGLLKEFLQRVGKEQFSLSPATGN